jgi:hypothetical protein
MKLFRNQDGQTLILTALCMTCFMGFMALAVDVGILFSSRRKLQNAADAAATAAALRYINTYTGSNGSAAQTAAIAAGNSAGQANASAGSVSVVVNTNPNSPAAHRGCVGTNCYFEAIVSQQNPTFFYSAFYALWKGQSAGTVAVAARAVAGAPGVADNCVYLTNKNGTALKVQGNWAIDASTCGVYINSSSSTVEDDTGKAAKSGISATSISIVGSVPNNVTIAPGSSPTVLSTLPQSIPFGDVSAPTVPATCPAAPAGKLTGSPAAGCYSGTVSIGNATLNGLYIFTGDVTINGAVTGTNVTLAIMNSGGTYGSLSVKPGNSTVNLTAPTTGTYSGIVVYQPIANTNALNLQAGNTHGTWTGWVYAPGATLSMQDNGSKNFTMGGLVVDHIDNGPAALYITGYTPSSSPLKYVALVE